jgi:hypothetical protein
MIAIATAPFLKIEDEAAIAEQHDNEDCDGKKKGTLHKLN